MLKKEILHVNICKSNNYIYIYIVDTSW